VTIGTIVCVDDQAEVRRLLGDVFRARGGSVVGFDDGEDAITWLGSNDADLNRSKAVLVPCGSRVAKT